MTWFRLPLFVWAMYATSLIILLATPVLAMTVTMLAVEPIFQIGIYDPALGGDPLLFQHMFWFYSHPAVYIMILPGMGIISEVITRFSQKTSSATRQWPLRASVSRWWAFSSGATTCSWREKGITQRLVFSLLSMFVAVPSAIKVFNWSATLYRGRSRSRLRCFTHLDSWLCSRWRRHRVIPGHAGNRSSLARHLFRHRAFPLHDGGRDGDGVLCRHSFLLAEDHREDVLRFLGANVAAILMCVGFFMTFVPQFVAGLSGMPRRYHAYPAELQVLNVLSSAGSTVLALGYLLPFSYLLHSLICGQGCRRQSLGCHRA